jgi:hypothetical protein
LPEGKMPEMAFYVFGNEILAGKFGDFGRPVSE